MIKLPKKSKTPKGAHGTYFKLTRTRGIKVLKGSFRSLASAYNSYTFDLAKEEAELLVMAEHTGIVPKCYGVRVVRRGHSYRVGILMEHLGNKTLEDMNFNIDKESKIYDNLNETLNLAGIEHSDLHSKNIMFHRGKCYAIDFSPGYTFVMESN